MAPAKRARRGSLDDGDDHPAENVDAQHVDGDAGASEDGSGSEQEGDCQEVSDSGGEGPPLQVVERATDKIDDQVVAESSDQVVEGASDPSAAQIAPQRKSRLMIKHIILENFKSYGGRKMIGPFHKSFSSIVGPNGSGKSNTIDALLFVFGKRAKKMRLNKVSELIHKSVGLQNCPSAKVEVVFQDIYDMGDGPEDYEVVEGSELSVAREAFKNNQSKYYMDGQGSNFTDVTTVLKKRGVDLEHNRFLILQGEVEQISLMKPKALTPHEDGLLEYLEDIIGSNRLVEPIEEAEKVVEEKTEQRQEKLNRLRVAERERESLDGPRREAEAWVSAEGERLELQSLVAQSEARKCHASLVGLEEEHKVLQSHMEEHRKKMEGFQKDVKLIEDEHNNQLKDYNNEKAQMEKSALDFKEFERQDVKFTEDIQFHEQKLVKLVHTEQEQRELAVKLVADAEQARKEAPLREQELDSAERFKVSLQQKLDKVYEGLKGKAEDLRGPKEEKEAALVPIQKELTEVKKVVEVAQTEARLLREKTTQISDEIDEVKRAQGECGMKLKERDQENKDTVKLKKDRVKLVSDATERLRIIEGQLETSGQEVSTKRTKAEEARSSLEQEHSRGQLIRAVYEQSRAGKLRGVHGRLGDLGTIGKKYDIAVSTACGMLDAIVVETTEDAQAVIQFVRQSKLGQTTCICLNQIRSRESEMSKEVATPENAPQLVDLIKPTKPEYKVAFFFALQRTLVAQDLDAATRIGLGGAKKWRVVTLQGGLIDNSGTMSGGGTTVAKGGMRASFCQHSPDEVKAIVEDYEKSHAQLATLRHEQRQLQEALDLTQKEISEFELREAKCEMDVKSLKKQMDAYEERLKSMKVPTLSGGEKSKLKELEKMIASKSDELNRIYSEHSALETEVRELHNQIMNIGGEELKTAKAKLDEATKKCEDMRKLIKKSLLDADLMDKNSKKAEAGAKTAKEEHGNVEKALKLLREEHAKLDDKAETVLNSYNKLKESLAVKDKTLTELRQKRDDVINAASAHKNQEVDLVHEMEEKTRTLRDLQARKTGWGNKLEEARKEYGQLPLGILEELRQAQRGPEGETETRAGQDLARIAISTDLAEEDLVKVVRADADARLLLLDQNLKNLKPNLASIEEFRRADGEHKSKLSDYEAVHTEREDARRNLEALRQQRLEEFMDGFSVISMKLKEMYQMITLGGDAELELVDTLDPFSEGINFSVRPPKKSWKQITNLSGGEKTLASLSLVFALHHYKPTPLYFMDEIDAALDFRNVSIIANYIKERTKNAQFIVISLRNHMFELADLLVGIYKTYDVSKSVAIDPLVFEKKNALQDKDTNIEPTRALTAGKRAPEPIEGPPATARRLGKENSA